MDKKLERSNAAKVLRRLTNQIGILGFNRTKPTFWTREIEHLVHFIHIHKFSFGPYFRIHTCVRVLNSPLNGIALFGPSEQELVDDSRFTFSESLDSVENCAKSMADFISNYSEKWYRDLHKPSILLGASSVLNEQDKASLQKALDGQAIDSNIERSRLLLKIT